MTGLRLNSSPPEALRAELTAESEPTGDPESGPVSEDSLADQVARAWDRIEAAPDDDQWVEAFMEWLDLHEKLMMRLPINDYST